MPIIVGAPRSGTTLLRLMLDSHPELAIPPETGFLALAEPPTRMNLEYHYGFLSAVTGFPPGEPLWPDYGISAQEFDAALTKIDPFDIADGFRTFYRMYASRMKKPRWGDKTPAYVLNITTIGQLLPEARFIHIVRDGRDVCLSWQQTWFRPSDDLFVLALHWRNRVLAGRRQGEANPNYLEVRYEDLIGDAPRTLAGICRFIELDFDPSMLRYHERAAVRLKEHRERKRADGTVFVSQDQRFRNQLSTMRPLDTSRVLAWRAKLNADQRRQFSETAGDVLQMFGYEA
jgi:hypothetical protein